MKRAFGTQLCQRRTIAVGVSPAHESGRRPTRVVEPASSLGQGVKRFVHRGVSVGALPGDGAIDHPGELSREGGPELGERPAREWSLEVLPLRHVGERLVAAGEVVEHRTPGEDVVCRARSLPVVLLTRVEGRRPGAQR